MSFDSDDSNINFIPEVEIGNAWQRTAVREESDSSSDEDNLFADEPVCGKILHNKFAAHSYIFYATLQLLTAVTLADVLYIVNRTVSTQAPFRTSNKNIRDKHRNYLYLSQTKSNERNDLIVIR